MPSAARSNHSATGAGPVRADRSPLAEAGADVLDWFVANGRDLPWRRTRDPWAVMVSELMLQQTQVARVVERWPRFLDRFPDPTVCAEAPRSELIEWWAGLGYNRRAVNLHRAAIVIRDDHGGVVPQPLADLLALPGIGPYTARAVRVFAFETNDAVLDTNVARILARTGGRPLSRREAQAAADAAVPPARGWSWNQALLDIGSHHCRSKQPRCGDCPLASRCAWRTVAADEPDPATGSAGVSSPQSRFEGSDRQGRGRLVDALRAGPVLLVDLARVMGWDDEQRARAVAETVVADGLAVADDDRLRLP